MLNDLIVSRVRVKILQLFFQYPDKIFHVRDIVRKISEEINAVRRELAHLEKAGLMTSERRANRLFYALRRDYPLYYDLLELIMKTEGLGAQIIRNKSKLGKIKFAMISGRFARNLKKENGSNDVDLLFVGKVVLPEVSSIIKGEEMKREREINYTVMSEEEFEFRKRRRDPFVLSILHGSRIMVIGDEEELIK